MVFLASKAQVDSLGIQNECPFEAEFIFFSESLCFRTTTVYSLAHCRVNAGSVCNPGTAEAEERKNDHYKYLVDDGYLFQPLAFEIPGAAGASTNFFEEAL